LLVIVLGTLLATCAERHAHAPPSDEHQVIAGVGTVRSPVLSRDGTATAFAAVGPGYVNPQIWIGRAGHRTAHACS